MKLIRYLLFPIVPIYYLVTWLRNKFYDWGIFKSTEHDVPTICVGNLSVGGTGKTPMIEYLIRLLKEDYQLATLSRGYKRSTKRFVIADEAATALTIGDEPFLIYSKFDTIIVCVDADRRNAITKLMQLENPPKLILLDDAFQHRKVKAKLNILLTSYTNLYADDILLPTGNLREPKSNAKRADVIVVTKCPESISDSDKKIIIELLKPKNHQRIFFSWIEYSNVIKSTFEEKKLEDLIGKNFTLVTGIANPKPLVDYLQSKNFNFEHLDFPDHHEFTSKEIENLKTQEFIITTEKDFMRLSPNFIGNKSLFYLPIELKIDRPKAFEMLVKGKIRLNV
ncbi:MAG: tetraacyldisaccharide 4'-kinase [Aquaticitalea sp.]